MAEQAVRIEGQTPLAWLDQRYKTLCEVIRAELLASDQEQYATLAGRVHDTGDESIADLLVDVNLAVIDHHIIELREVEGARLRVIRGEYGLCPDCGDSIDSERLSAYPTAIRCTDCQARHEHAYSHPGRPRL